MKKKNRHILFEDFSAEVPEDENEFFAYFNKNRETMFSDNIVADPIDMMTDAEKESIKNLTLNADKIFKLRLYILKGDERIGWFIGEQKNAETFYMRNTAIIELHRNKGIYKKLLVYVIGLLKEKGFQKITSTHIVTNNPVIVAKLKAGFIITGFEISDRFGLVVNLTFYCNEIRNKLMKYRTGEIKADGQLSKYININNIK